jgi:hypothetical protein
MRFSAQATTAALCLATTAQATTNHTRLQHWPKDAAAALEKMIVANANSSNYACFDMDVGLTSQNAPSGKNRPKKKRAHISCKHAP